jgi:hypothetical protein
MGTVASQAQLPPAELCGPDGDRGIELAPIIHPSLTGQANDHAFGCLAWQSFIYLNWPALAGSPGEPDPHAPFGRAGPTVWETFKRHDEIFLPEAQVPAAWGKPDRSQGGERRLGKVHQAGGGILIDRLGKPVYYEMLMNRDEFTYIIVNKLYDAQAQLAFARSSGIVLPAGPTPQWGPIGAIEVKAAWKLLTEEERAQRPMRFHTAEAILEDGSTATVGLVGLHLNQRVAGFAQGLWATFVQIDSAPPRGARPAAGHYSFYDPGCPHCASNAMTVPPQATQVELVFPVAPSVRDINAYALALMRQADPATPWQFYELLGVQWPQFAAGNPTPVPEPQRQAPPGVPLLVGTPSTRTLMNPVLETFQQVPNVSCFGCHAAAATALHTSSGPLAADYSFLFGHAKTR